MSSIPANYDSSSLSIDPGSINETAQNIENLVDAIELGVEAISQTLSDLTLSWAGQSASQAQQYNDEWNNAVTKLLGSQQDPSSGALNSLINGINYAAQNYSETENSIQGMFSKFAAGGSSSAGAAIDDPSGPAGLIHTTAVDEYSLTSHEEL